jgi:hypothetical protein
VDALEKGKHVKFQPKGTSMLPMLRQGKDSVVLSPLPERLKRYDIPLYRRQDGSYVLHRIVKVDSTLTCLGDNQFIPEPGITRQQLIGIVSGFYRGEKYYAVSVWHYRLYCRLWYRTRHLRRFWRRGISWLRRHRQ